MKILTMLATASALALSSAGAYAAEPINPENAVRQSIYDVSRHSGRVIAQGGLDGVALMSSRRTVETPDPINADNAVRESVYQTSRHNDRAVMRRLRDERRAVVSAKEDDRPYGPMYQPQDQVRQSIYDVNAGKKGNIDEYYYR